MLFFFHCNPRWVYGVFRDFFFLVDLFEFSFLLFSFRPIVMPYCSSIALHIAFSSYPKALDHSQLHLQFRHNIASTPNCCHMVCVTTSELLVCFSLRAFLKTVLYICSFTLLCSGRRYGFTFSGYVFHVTPVWINRLLPAVFNLKFMFSRLPLL